MPSDPFVILGIQKGASQSEILEAYKTKRAYYQQHVFDEGEAGATPRVCWKCSTPPIRTR